MTNLMHEDGDVTRLTTDYNSLSVAQTLTMTVVGPQGAALAESLPVSNKTDETVSLYLTLELQGAALTSSFTPSNVGELGFTNLAIGAAAIAIAFSETAPDADDGDDKADAKLADARADLRAARAEIKTLKEGADNSGTANDKLADDVAARDATIAEKDAEIAELQSQLDAATAPPPSDPNQSNQ